MAGHPKSGLLLFDDVCSLKNNIMSLFGDDLLLGGNVLAPPTPRI
jgi:hypothetical protein